MHGMDNWVYPVNQQSHVWEGPPLPDYFRARDFDDWYLATAFRQINVGDRVWAYASMPNQRIMGVGVVVRLWTDTFGDAVRHRAGIEWDRATNRDLVTKGPQQSLDQPPRGIRRLHTTELQRLDAWLSINGTAPPSLDPERRKRLMEVTVRQGQGEFRDQLLLAYDSTCAISGCTMEATLQAAHIAGYAGGGSHHVTNGLLLRADLHLLFDLDLIWVDGSYVVHLAPEVTDQAYRRFDGKKLNLPKRVADRPSKRALQGRRAR